MNRISIFVLCLSFAAWSEDSKPAPLSADDEKLAASLLKDLGDDEFEKREQAQEQLTKLVFSEPAKAVAWDQWVAHAKNGTLDAERSMRLPIHIALRSQLCKRFKSIDGALLS